MDYCICSGEAAGMLEKTLIVNEECMPRHLKRVVYEASPLVNSMCLLGKLSACSCVLVCIDSMFIY